MCQCRCIGVETHQYDIRASSRSEGDVGRFGLHCPLPDADILGKGPTCQRPTAPEYLITGLEPRDALTDRFHSAREVGPEYRVLWLANTHRARSA